MVVAVLARATRDQPWFTLLNTGIGALVTVAAVFLGALVAYRYSRRGQREGVDADVAHEISQAVEQAFEVAAEWATSASSTQGLVARAKSADEALHAMHRSLNRLSRDGLRRACRQVFIPMVTLRLAIEANRFAEPTQIDQLRSNPVVRYFDELQTRLSLVSQGRTPARCKGEFFIKAMGYLDEYR